MENEIKSRLRKLHDVSIGYNTISFVKPADFELEQEGYRYDSQGKTLVDLFDASCKKEWYVIATDQLGDPIIVDTSTNKLSVLSAPHGEGLWKSFVIADGFEAFEHICSMLIDMSEGRSSPVEIEAKPITDKEKDFFIKSVASNNTRSEIWYWELFLE